MKISWDYRQSQKYTHGVGNQDLGLTRMVWITVPLPPLEEQRAIISEIDRRLSIIREMEHEVEVNLKRAERLRQSIFKKAFSGTLVQQEKVVYSAGARSDLPMAAEEIMPYGKKA